MMYNFVITPYDDEIQINYYQIAFNNHEDEEKESNNYAKNIMEIEGVSETDLQSDCDTSETDLQSNKIRSTRRTKQTIYEIARANDWQYFATFTLKDNYRYDYNISKNKLTKWFNNIKSRKIPDLKYLVVPEKHKDGAIHFHALLSGNLDPYLTIKAGERGSKGVMGFDLYRMGISEVEKVKNRYKVSNYITKYITKDLLTETKNAKRYFCSTDLKRPEKNRLYSRLKLPAFIERNFPNYEIAYIYSASKFHARYVQLRKKDS